MELPELSTLIPSAGVLGLLGWLVVHYVRIGGSDRRSYTAQITEVREANDRQIEALTARHDRQAASLRAEMDQLRAELETERRARWAAEDAAAKWRRAAEGNGVDDAST